MVLKEIAEKEIEMACYNIDKSLKIIHSYF